MTAVFQEDQNVWPQPVMAETNNRWSAIRAGKSRGRRYHEEPCPLRSPYQRDRDRIVHSKAFRRLTHKTQVFLYDEGDHFRNRLTHSLEVAQIGRALARLLNVDEDLTEAIALAHDLGHTPFGHAGERGLNRAMAAYGGFDHNAQSLRVVTLLERNYSRFDGLNLSFETLEGLAKHNGPVSPNHPPAPFIADYNSWHDLDLTRQAGVEAQIAALSDDIAYNNHDLDDGLRAGLFSLTDLASVPLVWRIIQEITLEHPGLSERRVVYELNRRLITSMIKDVVSETQHRLAKYEIASAEDVRNAKTPIVGFSPGMAGKLTDLQRFLFERVYRHRKVMEVMEVAEQMVERLTLCYLESPHLLPEKWRQRFTNADHSLRPAIIIDFVAGMTDRYAIDEHRRLFSCAPQLRARIHLQGLTRFE